MPITTDKTGKRFTFAYRPESFAPIPEYTAHMGKTVHVVRQLTGDECDDEEQPMWLVRTADGWEGHAFDDELIEGA